MNYPQPTLVDMEQLIINSARVAHGPDATYEIIVEASSDRGLLWRARVASRRPDKLIIFFEPQQWSSSIGEAYHVLLSYVARNTMLQMPKQVGFHPIGGTAHEDAGCLCSTCVAARNQFEIDAGQVPKRVDGQAPNGLKGSGLNGFYEDSSDGSSQVLTPSELSSRRESLDRSSGQSRNGVIGPQLNGSTRPSPIEPSSRSVAEAADRSRRERTETRNTATGGPQRRFWGETTY